MTPEIFSNIIFPCAFKFMAPKLNSNAARAMLLAIGWQESDFEHRKQLGGPAQGYFQFEMIGVRGSLMHHRTGKIVRAIAGVMGYENAKEIHPALENNDLLATVLARYNLYNFPGALPDRGDAEEGWRQYLDQWRPGRPRHERWEERFNQAWRIVLG